mgnify:FL=1
MLSFFEHVSSKNFASSFSSSFVLASEINVPNMFCYSILSKGNANGVNHWQVVDLMGSRNTIITRHLFGLLSPPVRKS